MSRKVIDTVFEETNKERGNIVTDQNFYYMYGGTVQVGYPKMKIKTVTIQGTAHDLLADIRRKYEAVKLEDEPAMIIVGDCQINTFPEVVRCIKALLMGQLSRNEQFSIAVAHAVTQLIQMCMKQEAVLPISCPENFTKFQRVVLNHVSGFIKECFIKEGIGWDEAVEQEVVEVQTVEESDIVDIDDLDDW